MSRFNLPDTQSSTLPHATDSVDEMFDAVQPMVRAVGLAGRSGLSPSVHIVDTDECVEADNEAIMILLKWRMASSVTVTPRRESRRGEPRLNTDPDRQSWARQQSEPASTAVRILADWILPMLCRTEPPGLGPRQN